MKKLILLLALFTSFSSFATDECSLVTRVGVSSGMPYAVLENGVTTEPANGGYGVVIQLAFAERIPLCYRKTFTSTGGRRVAYDLYVLR